ncbi:MAG: GNAT family N-acetyltransferase [Betaproteobacteria bacterium]|nr:GNAT family N-acetyltransferase [Betaproteobacteria bacterium]
MKPRVLGAEAARGLVHAIARQRGAAIDGEFVPADAVADAYLAGAERDVLILPHSAACRLTAQGRVALDFCTDLGARGAPATVYTVALAKENVGEAAREFALRLTAPDTAGERASAGFAGARIRRATGADSAQARDLVFGVLAEYGLAPEPTGIDADLLDLDAGFLQDGGLFDVAIDPDGRVAACCGMKILGGGRVELRKMYVRRGARGAGLGQRLLDRALAWARARGHPRVDLETASVLKEAIALYRKAGFVQRPGKPDTCRCDQAFMLELG